jgi:predicted GNAT family acetyltransferase
MDEKQLQFLYNEYAKNKGFKDYSEFKGLMSSEGSRKLFFDDANKELGFKDFNEFDNLLGLKKKVGGEVSSPTKSQLQLGLPDFEKGKAFAEKGFLMQAEGTKAPKKQKISIEPSLSLLGVPKVEVLEEGEDPSLLASFTSAGIKGQIQGKVANILSAGRKPAPEELGEIAQLQSDINLFPQSKAERTFQEKGLAGLFKESPALGLEFIAETIVSSASALVESSKKTVPAGVVMGAAAGAPFAGIGVLPGALTGIAAGQVAAGYNLSTSSKILEVLSKEGVDITNKESLINAFSDDQKMSKIRTTAAKYGVPIAIVDAVTGGIAGKLAAGAVGKSLAKRLAAGFGEAGIQVTGGASGDLAGQLASGQKVNWDDVMIEGIAAVPGGVTEVVSGVSMERAKASSNNKTLATQIATQGVEDGSKDAVINLNRDLANNVITPEQYQEGIVFAEKAAQVVDKIPTTVTGESRVKSIELLVERNDIDQANQNLLQQKQTTDVAYHAGIDEEIKANEERIKKLDSEVYNIAKKPSKEFGGKKYIVDGEEVSQAEFEALQGKPVGTKEIIKAEVKPEEVKPTEVDLADAEKMNASQNRYGIVKDGAEAGFIVTTNPENNVVKIKGVTVNEELRGKNIAGDAYVKLGESLAKEGVSLESDSFDKMEPSATRVWEKLADKGLAVKGENSYQFKPTEVKEAPKQEKKLGKSLISEEPIQGKGVVIATETGLTEQERLDKIAEREKQTKISDKVNTENALVQETKLFYEKNKRQRSSSEGLRKLNELRTRARELGLEIDDASESVVRKKGSRKTKIKYNSKADADSIIDKSGKTIYERRKDVQDVFKILNDNKNFLDFKTDLGVRMSDAQLDATIQDILDGVPSKRANRYLDEVQKAIDNDAFGLKDMGNNALTLEQIMESDRDINKIEKELVGKPMDQKALEDWLNDQSNLTPEEEAIMIDDFENLLNEYEYENETRPEAEVPRAKPAPEEGVVAKAEPTEINKKTTSIESKKEVTLQDIYEGLPKSEKLKNKQLEEIVDKNFDSIIKQLEKYKIC